MDYSTHMSEIELNYGEIPEEVALNYIQDDRNESQGSVEENLQQKLEGQLETLPRKFRVGVEGDLLPKESQQQSQYKSITL
ncbi:Tax1-Binding Protein 1 [Manis pentadactyla]|nr:Tax1-Binding Protein 1 [Manis pentadactyla]